MEVNKHFSDTIEIGIDIVNNIDTIILSNYDFWNKFSELKSFHRIVTDVETRKFLDLTETSKKKNVKLQLQKEGVWGFMFFHNDDHKKYYTWYRKIEDFIKDLKDLDYRKVKKIVIAVCNLEYEGIGFDGYLSKKLKIKTGIKRNPNGLRPWSASYKLNKIGIEIIDVQRIFTFSLNKNAKIFFGKSKEEIDFNKDWTEFDNIEDKEKSKIIIYNLQDCNITLGLLEMSYALLLSKKQTPYTMGGIGTSYLKKFFEKTKFLSKNQKFADRKAENTYYILKDATNGAYCEAFELGNIIKNTDFDKFNLMQVDFVNQYGSVCCCYEFPDSRCESVKTTKPDFWNKEGNVFVNFLRFVKIPQPIIGFELNKDGKTDEQTQQNKRKIFSNNVKGTYNLIYPEMRYLINTCNLMESVDYEIIVAFERERAPYQFMKDFFETFSQIRNENLDNKAIVQLCKDIPNAVTGKFGQHVRKNEDTPWFSDPLLNAYILFGGRNMLFEYMQVIQDYNGEVIKSVTDSIMFRLPKNVNIYDILPVTDKKFLGCVNLEHEYNCKDKLFVITAKRYYNLDKVVFSSFAAPKENYDYEKFLQEIDQGYSIDETINPVKTISMAKFYPEFYTGKIYPWQSNEKIFYVKIPRGLKYNSDKIIRNCKIVGRPWRISVKGFAYNRELESKS